MRFREFVHTLERVVAKPTHQRVCSVATRRNTQNRLKKFVYYRKRRRTYSLIEMGEKSTKGSLFFIYIQLTVIHARIRVFSRDFRAFCRFLNSSSAKSVTGETVETTTDQRNLSIIGRDKIYISSKKREEMQFIYFFEESREQ